MRGGVQKAVQGMAIAAGCSSGGCKAHPLLGFLPRLAVRRVLRPPHPPTSSSAGPAACRLPAPTASLPQHVTNDAALPARPPPLAQEGGAQRNAFIGCVAIRKLGRAWEDVAEVLVELDSKVGK